jgi:SNF2 family DNA or RNA helicase
MMHPSDHVRVALSPDFLTFDLFPQGEREAKYGAWRQRLVDVHKKRQFDNEWPIKVGATDHNAHVVQEAFPVVEFFDGRAETIFNKLLLTHKSRRIAQLAQASWMRMLDSPNVDEEAKAVQYLTTLSEHPDLPLAGYQKLATSAAAMCRNYALWMEQGTGKTPCVISRICTDVMNFPNKYSPSRMYRALVVCPKGLRLNWQREIERFQSVKGQATVLRGSTMKRTVALAKSLIPQTGEEKFTVLIVSYGLLVETLPLICSIPWDLAVLDEAHGIKAPQTARTKACHQLRDSAESRMTLTGTPICNTALDVWSQLEFVEAGASGYTSWANFKQAYGKFTKSRDGRNKDILCGVQNVPVLQEQISRVAFVVRKDQVMKDLPKKQYDIVEVEMTRQQRSDYESLAHTLMVKFEQAMANAENAGQQTLVVNNILTQLLRLAQITSGFLVIPEEHDVDGSLISKREIIRYRPNPKLEALVEEVERMDDTEKMLVWACWHEDIDSISEALTERSIKHVVFDGRTKELDRDKAVTDFNEDRATKVFIGNAGAGGVGLNLLGYPPGQPELLDTDCTRIIYYSQNWSYQTRAQSEDRAHRRGTRRPVRITDLCVPDSIDEEIRERVLGKKVHALEVQDLYAIFQKVTECQD